MEDDLDRFTHETYEEAHYWFCVTEFAKLSLDNPLDDMLHDMLQYRHKLKAKEQV